uniref:Uncharacterized protein n=1 Tax=Arcella intermedia TaxID=1963864 RepID=A0A6B2LNH8_9EUKA
MYCIYATIPANTYDTIFQKSQKYSKFVLPLPRSSHGMIEFIYLEVKGHVLLFSRLSEIKEKGAQASPLLKVIHFVTYKEKGIVLMRGEVDDSKLSLQEAGILVSLYELYYLKDDYYSLVETFNVHPEKFNFEDLLRGLKPEK